MKCDICNLEDDSHILKVDGDDPFIIPCRVYLSKDTHKLCTAVKKIRYICFNCLCHISRENESVMIKSGYDGAFDHRNGFEEFTFLPEDK